MRSTAHYERLTMIAVIAISPSALTRNRRYRVLEATHPRRHHEQRYENQLNPLRYPNGRVLFMPCLSARTD